MVRADEDCGCAEVGSLQEQVSEILDAFRINNQLMYHQMAEAIQVILRLYELLYIGKSDVQKEEYKDDLIPIIIDLMGDKKFKQWVKDASKEDRDWSFLYQLPGVENGTS